MRKALIATVVALVALVSAASAAARTDFEFLHEGSVVPVGSTKVLGREILEF